MAEWLMVILTFVYVIATIAICIFNYKSAKATREQIAESKRQFEEVNRPYVNIVFEIVKGGLACLIISNNGSKIAENVKININKNFLDLLNEQDRKQIMKFTSESIVIGINQKWILCIGSHLELTKLSKEKIIVDITYNDGEKQFKDKSTITLNGYLGTLMIEDTEGERNKSLKNISNTLVNVNKKIDNYFKKTSEEIDSENI